jgi:CHAT domain-containing protein
LNLSAEGRTLASRAEQAFAKLGMRYEQAKAFVNLAVAASQRGYLSLADAKLRRARTLFAREGNRVWCAMTDLLRAVLAYHDQRYRATERLSSTAWKTLANTPMPGRAAHCQLLLARLWLQGGHADRALAVGRAALERVGDASSPALRFHARLLEGEVHEAKARWTQAIDAYERARAEIETLRTRVDTEDLRISILKDKLAVYDALVSLILAIPSADGWRRVLLLVQHAKSRAFADRLRESHSEIEAELNWCHRQIETAAPQRAPSALLSRVREIERELASRTGEPSASLESIQNALPGNAVVLEYFEARNVLHAFVMDRKGVHAISLGHSLPVRQAVKLVHFQLGKQRSSISAGLDAIHHHLGELYDLLIAPIEPAISKAEHLLIAPHRYLHGVPFAALNRAGRALIDRHTIAMIPSAHVFARLRGRSPQPSYGAAVFAAGSEHMLSEGALVSRILGGRLVQGAEATFDGFRETAASARLVHVAAHGVFRKDNPLFSSIRFADREVTLSDLKAIGLRADLVTLSACSTGRSVSVGGDELLGLMRAFLSSGASNVLASLWEIDDAVTNEFMKSFYKNFLAENSPAEALREAMLEVRRRYAHPYYWAPFIFTGRSV